jgi:hypothetical protein
LVCSKPSTGVLITGITNNAAIITTPFAPQPAGTVPPPGTTLPPVVTQVP